MQAAKDTRYIETVGRRKTSIARVRMTPTTKGSVVVNEKDLNTYFPTTDLQRTALSPLNLEIEEKFKITALISGGGIHSQAEALRHGIARGLVEFNEMNRKKQKKAGFLKRDPRAKERRKFGLKKARKAPQWSKR
jgi:small subunit ribosomal protein S9